MQLRFVSMEANLEDTLDTCGLNEEVLRDFVQDAVDFEDFIIILKDEIGSDSEVLAGFMLDGGTDGVILEEDEEEELEEIYDRLLTELEEQDQDDVDDEEEESLDESFRYSYGSATDDDED